MFQKESTFCSFKVGVHSIDVDVLYTVVYCIIITSAASSFFSVGSAAPFLLLTKYTENIEVMMINHL